MHEVVNSTIDQTYINKASVGVRRGNESIGAPHIWSNSFLVLAQKWLKIPTIQAWSGPKLAGFEVIESLTENIKYK